MPELRNPIFGRADESPEDDDTAFMLEGRLATFCNSIRTLHSKMEDHLPDPKFHGQQAADDWAKDLDAALGPMWAAICELEAKLRRCSAIRAVRPVVAEATIP